LIHQTIQVAAVRLIRVNELLSRLKTLLFEFVASIGVVNQRSEWFSWPVAGPDCAVHL